MNSLSVTVGGEPLTVKDVVRIARDGARVELSRIARLRVSEAAKFVQELITAGRPVYGVNTGVGGLSGRALPADAIPRFQENLIRSNAAGVGAAVPHDVVRALMLLRANTLALGYSGVSVATLELLLALLNAGITPVVPCQGSVGASGDLAPLAHTALVLIGRGEADIDGRRLSGADALRHRGLEPVTLQGKDGSALINGTQAMAAYGVLSIYDAERAIETANTVAALTVEALRGIGEAFDSRIHALRPHPGQVRTAAAMRALLAESARLREPDAGHVHDAYSLRCIPQVHGAAWDVLSFAQRTLSIEINAVSDNPIVFAKTGTVLSGGNFHGEYLGYALDSLGMAMVGLMNISERRTARLVDQRLSGLPPFLAVDDGMSSGMMVAQYTAAALVSEGKVLATPSSVDSIPTSADQEDYVSMGLFSARKTAHILSGVWHVLAVEALCAAQALDMTPGINLGRGTDKAYTAIRGVVPSMTEDRELAPDIASLAAAFQAGSLLGMPGDSA